MSRQAIVFISALLLTLTAVGCSSAPTAVPTPAALPSLAAPPTPTAPPPTNTRLPTATATASPTDISTPPWTPTLPTNSLTPGETLTPTRYPTPVGVTFKFDDGVSADQRQIIESGMSLALSFLGDAGPVTVLAYANFDNLANDTDQAFHRTSSSQGSLTFRQSFLNHIWKASGGAGTISIWVDDTWKGLSIPVRMHTLSHEYFHTIQAGLSNKAITTTGPIWLYEGAADIAGFGAVASAGGVYTLDQVDAYKITASRGLLSPLSSMITLGDTEKEDSTYPYQLGYLAIEYLIPGSVSDRLTVLRKYWEAQGKGAAWQDAFKQTFGISVEEFYPKFEEYRQAKFPPYCGTVGVPVAQATPAPFGVRFIRKLAPGEMLALDQPWSGPPNIPYVFCVDGFSLQSLSPQLGKAFTLPAGRAGWSTCGAGCITIYMKPNTPAGRYNFAVTLPDGRRAEAFFEH